ncbi:MAG: hypothetical protein ABJA98_32035 [Acidobacteriota bacterium]
MAGEGRRFGAINNSTREVRYFAREYGREAIAFLAEVMMDVKGIYLDKDRLWAARELLDRGYGKPSQHLRMEVEQAPLALQNLSAQQLAERAEAIAVAMRQAADAEARHQLPAAPTAIDAEVVEQPVGSAPPGKGPE